MKNRSISDTPLALKIIKAIENDEFQILYQPKFEIESMNINGAEALIRWRKINGDIIYPDLFIPQLEENKEIYLVDYYILESCIRQISEWNKNDIKLISIAINMSKSTIMRKEFISQLKFLINKYKVKDFDLEIEITERESFEKDVENIGDKIRKIKELGIKVSLDDFGAGSANIMAIAKIDFDYVKIDKSIIDDIGNYKVDNILIGIKNIMDRNNISVIAEGIETKEQHELLLEYGYVYGQGYYFSEPISVKVLEKKYLTKISA